MNGYSILEKRAQKLLDICIKYQEDLDYFLFEGPGFELYTKNSYGEKEFAVNVRVQAIYEKYKTYPEVKDLFEKTLESIADADKNKSGEYIIYLLLIVEYQLKKEKMNEAPFKVDVTLILEKLKNNIAKNYNLYNRSFTNYPNGFISIFQKHNSILEENYGYKIL